MAKKIENVELFDIGVWNGKAFLEKDLKEMEEAYKAFTGVLRVPLKLGHNDEQKITDGQPAIGWLSNVRLSEDKKLVGDFADDAVDGLGAEMMVGTSL